MSLQAENKNNQNNKNGKLPKSQVRWYLVGFALLGGVIGYFAGSSQTPVIGILLPLIFGLIGGAGGIYLARVDFSKANTSYRLGLLGNCFTAFVILMVLGSMYGIALRTNSRFSHFLSPFKITNSSDKSIIDIEGLTVLEATELVVLRRRLEALGATGSEQQTILKKAMSGLLETLDGSSVASLLRKLSALARQTRRNGVKP